MYSTARLLRESEAWPLLAALIRTAVGGLPPDERAVVRGIYWHDRTRADMAVLLACSAAKIREHEEQAIARLAREVMPFCAALGAAG